MFIGFTGKATSGKNTASDILESLGFVYVDYAEPLKEACMFKYGLSHDDVFTQEGKKRHVPEWGMTVRKILQLEGQQTKETWGEDFWVRRLRVEVEPLLARGQTKIAVRDVRTNLEALELIKRGGVIVEITREGAGLQGEEAKHVSEKGISADLVTIRIENDGSIDDLQRKVVEFYNKVKED